MKFKWIDGFHPAVPPPGFEGYFGPPPLYRFANFDGSSVLDDAVTMIRNLPAGETPEDTMRNLAKELEPSGGKQHIAAVEKLFEVLEEDPEINVGR